MFMEKILLTSETDAEGIILLDDDAIFLTIGKTSIKKMEKGIFFSTLLKQTRRTLWLSPISDSRKLTAVYLFRQKGFVFEKEVGNYIINS